VANAIQCSSLTVCPAGEAVPPSCAVAPPLVGACKALVQPCAAFDGRLCRIYADRPQYCREFECALFKRVQAGRYPAVAALAIIRSTRKRTGTVRGLLRLLGDTDETSALALRFKGTAKRLETSSPEKKTADRFGQLTIAMHDLNQTLSSRFYPGAPK